MIIPHWPAAGFSTPRSAIRQSIERRHDDRPFRLLWDLLSKRRKPVYWTLVQYEGGGTSSRNPKFEARNPKDETRYWGVMRDTAAEDPRFKISRIPHLE